jgi:hypothetical protein
MADLVRARVLAAQESVWPYILLGGPMGCRAHTQGVWVGRFA